MVGNKCLPGKRVRARAAPRRSGSARPCGPPSPCKLRPDIRRSDFFSARPQRSRPLPWDQLVATD
eukprot:4658760-Pyramimonas_sp.AAC.1